MKFLAQFLAHSRCSKNVRFFFQLPHFAPLLLQGAVMGCVFWPMPCRKPLQEECVTLSLETLIPRKLSPATCHFMKFMRTSPGCYVGYEIQFRESKAVARMPRLLVLEISHCFTFLSFWNSQVWLFLGIKTQLGFLFIGGVLISWLFPTTFT